MLARSVGYCLCLHVIMLSSAKDGKEWDVFYVKNSWGPGYGDKGYMMFARGNHTGGRDIWDGGNLCGIASCAGYPLV